MMLMADDDRLHGLHRLSELLDVMFPDLFQNNTNST